MKIVYFGAVLGIVAAFALAVVPVFAADGYCYPGSVTAGGNLVLTGEMPAKISFAGNIQYDKLGLLKGNWQVQFHDVMVDELDKAMFKAAEVQTLWFLPWAPKYCGYAVPPDTGIFNFAAFQMVGKLNGEDGWVMKVRMTDYGEAGKDNDTIRFILFDPAGDLAYDSYYEFGGEWDWCTALRVPITGGNLQIHPGTCEYDN